MNDQEWHVTINYLQQRGPARVTATPVLLSLSWSTVHAHHLELETFLAPVISNFHMESCDMESWLKNVAVSKCTLVNESSWQ